MVFNFVAIFGTWLRWEPPHFQWSWISHSSSDSFHFEEVMILEYIYHSQLLPFKSNDKIDSKKWHISNMAMCGPHGECSFGNRSPEHKIAVRHILYGWTARLDGGHESMENIWRSFGNSARMFQKLFLFIPNFASDRYRTNAWRFIELSPLIGF